DGHDVAPAEAPLEEQPGDPVGHGPDLGVGGRLLVVDARHLVGVAGHLPLEEGPQVDPGGVAGVDAGRPGLGRREIGPGGRRGAAPSRIHPSHTPPGAVEPTTALIRRYSNSPICLDTQGAQVRCGKMAEGTVLTAGTTVALQAADVMGGASEMTLWPASVFASMRPGDLVHVDFDGALLQVMDVAADHGSASAVVLEGGRVKSNRAVVMDPPPTLGPITDKDTTAIEIGVRLGIRHYALSFASSAGDVELILALVPEGSTVISKIESRAGVR